ncbi:MAG: DinB family protein, partial [Oceanospirillaceae bacterium]|nr:DinB family protein [Oceanospirillaceae bacterium]
DGDRGKITRQEILLHVVTHGGYHRGQVGQIIRAVNVLPPRDIYTRFLHLTAPSRIEENA